VADDSPSTLSRLASLRRHGVFLGVLTVAVMLRIAVMRAYPYAFFLADSRSYADYAERGIPNPIRPYGYSAFLDPFVPGPMIVVAAIQHVLVIGLLVLGYVFLLRRGVRPWLAGLAVAPFALTGRELTLEHLVLAETLFVVLAGAGLMLLAWRERIRPWMAIVAGLLIAASTLTRSVGLPLAALCVAFLLVRWSGWRPLAGFVVALALPLGGYVVWYHQNHDVYAFGEFSGRFLHGRVQTFADCREIPSLTAEERLLCDDRPLRDRPERPDWYVWSPESPGMVHAGTVKDDPVLGSFAKKAILAQPGDFLVMLARETTWHFDRHPPMSAEFDCDTFGKYDLPATPGSHCSVQNYYPVAEPRSVPEAGTLAATPIRKVLWGWSLVTSYLIGPLLAVALAALLGAVAWPRRGGWSLRWSGLFLGAAGLGLIMASVATSMYEPRYAVPALFFLPLGAALALQRLLGGRDEPATEKTSPADPADEKPADEKPEPIPAPA
jgi:MFS family permease